ncbi:protein MIGRI [Silvimonas soli]|uniref:protein MIGRI n=1 Tax=Silvimonas soli TaxID=2980100 RepID=UPI003CC8316A
MLSAFSLALRLIFLLLAAWLIFSRLFPRARQEVDRVVNITAMVLVVASSIVVVLHFFH